MINKNIFCSECGASILRKKKTEQDNYFCSKECQKIFNEKRYYKDFECVQCGKKKRIKKSDNRKTCSSDCRKKWVIESGLFSGNNNPRYRVDISDDNRTLFCEWCGKKYVVGANKINKSRYCSIECRREWYSKVWSQNENWKNKKSIQAAKQMKSNKNKTETIPQKKINDVLIRNNIEFENEQCFEMFSVDNFLFKHNIIIEVMGDYWHCNHLVFSEIQQEHQINRIRMDKIKSSYFKNKKIPVLYLWERDINNDIFLCEKIILFFIENKNRLLSEHSFNYVCCDNSVKKIKNEIPYMERTIEEIRNIIKLKKTGKRKKDESKWMKFKCDSCDKECEILISKYKLRTNHYCSYDCYRNHHKKNLSLND